MKKILSLGFVLVILVNSMGYYIIFEINRYFIRKEMRETIGTGKKICVLDIPDPLNDKRIKWIDKHEIMIHNRLYDVIYTSSSGNKMRVYCYRDVKEENLIASYQKANSSKITQAIWHLLSKMAPTCCSLQVESIFPVDYSFPILMIKITRIFNPPGNPPPRTTS